MSQSAENVKEDVFFRLKATVETPCEIVSENAAPCQKTPRFCLYDYILV